MNVSEIISSLIDNNTILHIHAGDSFMPYYLSEHEIAEPISIDSLYHGIVTDMEGNETVVKDIIFRHDTKSGKYYRIQYNKENGIHTMADMPAVSTAKFVLAQSI